MISFAMQALNFRAFRKDTFYFRTNKEREKISARVRRGKTHPLRNLAHRNFKC